MLENYSFITTDEAKKNTNGFVYNPSPFDTGESSFEELVESINTQAKENVNRLILNIRNSFPELLSFESEFLYYIITTLENYHYPETTYSKLGTDESSRMEELHDYIFKSLEMLDKLYEENQKNKVSIAEYTFRIAFLLTKIKYDNEYESLEACYSLEMAFLETSIFTTLMSEQYYELFFELLDKIEKAVYDHKHTLFQKMRTLIKKDEYGFINDSGWNDEKNMFSFRLINSLNDLVSEDIFTSALSVFIVQKLIPEIVEVLDTDEQSGNLSRLLVNKEDKVPYERGMDYENDCLQEFKNFGWSASKTPAGGDKGVDILATKESVTIAVQCKNWSNKINIGAVQEVYSGKDYYNADFSIVLSESGATAQALELSGKLKTLIINIERIRSVEALILGMMLGK